jgi:RHH-type proline utilization regulon transcriptional repressor/proline dehydrogenase/delta 1-pyrroline-5-carboxylate dehydrogenase
MLSLPADFSAADLAAIERATHEVGRWLFAHLDTRQPTFLQRGWWDQRLMEWAMRDETVKVQMFRFIDVLPMLAENRDVSRHLQEYLGPVRDRLPAAARLSLDVARGFAPAQHMLANAARTGAAANARRFIAGGSAKEVLEVAFAERLGKRAFTLDVLGEAVTSEFEAERYLRAYVDLIEAIAPTVNAWPEVTRLDRDDRGPIPRVNVSVKLSALDSQFDSLDPEGTTLRVAARLRTLLRTARRHRAHVHVDMESYQAKHLTLAIFQAVLAEEEFRDWPDVGIVVQCYLKDSQRDLEQLAEWTAQRGTPIWVRLVKGAYWDYETVHAISSGWPVPVFRKKFETDANFERLARRVLQRHELLRPALGSHNVRSLANGIATAQFLGLPAGAYEIQMLYGMADPEKQAIVDLGQRMRIYMPYGELIPGMAYLVRRLLENTSNESFVRASLSRHIAMEELLMNPEDRGQGAGARGQGSGASGTGGRPAPGVSPGARDEQRGERKALPFRNEPLADFAVADNRMRMREALNHVKTEFGQTYPLWIDGQAVAGGGSLKSIDPSDFSQVVGIAAAAESRHAGDAVAAARRALPAWIALGARGRAEYLLGAAEALRSRRFELAAWEVFECGKPWREADGDVCEAIDYCEYYAQSAIAMDAGRKVHVPGEENRTEYLPRGVAAVVAPWNFPLAILTGMTTAALATGNTVVMKPAEQSPVIAAKLMEIFSDVRLPPGVLNYLPGRGEIVGAALVDHPDVALIAFTGSRAVGLAINRRAAEISATAAGIRQVKRVIIEMGGKNAILVDDDADLDEAVAGVVASAFGYQGQKCSACSRAVVIGSVYEAFLNRLVEAARSLKVGPADDPSSRVGPVIDAEAFERIRGYIDLGRREAREVLAVDVGRLAERGYFIGPHIFADVPPSSRLAQEEIFGPVLSVLRAADLDEALRIANDTDYALTAGIFSRSPAHLDRAARELQAGNVYLNRPITGALVNRQPFGGFKLSGIGDKAGGPDYLLQFVVERTITENTLRRGFAPPAAEEE